MDIIGTEAFENFVRGLKGTDNVEFQRRRVDAPLEGRTVAVMPSRVPAYDILIPQLSNLLRRSQEAIANIDVERLTPRLKLTGQTFDESQMYTLRDVLTKEVERVLDLKLPLPTNSTGILWFYTQSIVKEARVPKTISSEITRLVKHFLARVAFSQTVDLDDPRIWYALMQDAHRESVVKAFVSAINRVTREESTVELREQARPVSQTAAFVWGKDVYEGQKTVFNLVAVDNLSLEGAFAEFLDKADDVAAYAKNTNKVGLNIDYQSVKGHFRLYQPDYVVRLTNGDHWLVETKGAEDLEVRLKDDRARVWCADATELTASTRNQQRWRYVKVLQPTFHSHRGKTFGGLAAHASVVAEPLLISE